MSAGKRNKEDAGWKALALLAATLLVAAYGILFVPAVRETFGLSSKPVLALPKLFGGGAKTSLVVRRASANIPKDELEAFVSSFVSREVEVFLLPAEPAHAVPSDPEVEEEREERIKSLWEIRVGGTFPDLEGNWLAIINRQYCKVGRRIESAVEGRCAYQILGVGKTCVWMVAYDKEKDGQPPKVPEVSWPDVSFIVTERVDGRIQPTKVRFARGTEVSKYRPFKISRDSKVTFSVVCLFDHGVCFEMTDDESRSTWYLGCMVVAP